MVQQDNRFLSIFQEFSCNYSSRLELIHISLISWIRIVLNWRLTTEEQMWYVSVLIDKIF